MQIVFNFISVAVCGFCYNL